MVRDDEKVEIIFYRARIRLRDKLEINLLKSIHPDFTRDFTINDDQLIIRIHPPNYYHDFHIIHQTNKESRYRFAYNIIQAIQNQTMNRIKLVVCPENIMFDQGLTPHFLHYGVQESIPPYENDLERTWQETKATVAACVDETYNFSSYLLHYETIPLSPVTKKIMEAENIEQLLQIMEENLKQLAEYEKTVVHIPKKRWTLSQYMILFLALALIPSVVYSISAIFFKIPQSEAYVEANRFFLQDEYSSVISTLENYDDHEDMPYVVQYQLAHSYLTLENLDELQRENVMNTITLQSNQNYFKYWIDIGRENYEEAIDVARILESRDLIMYGLLKEREAVKTDSSLTGGEREEKVKAINNELAEYQTEIDEEKKEMEEQEAMKEDESVPEDSADEG
jgi:type VII secretion protein EssB